MKVQDRPYAGNWSEDFLNKYRTTRSWTPDAIVTFNGETTLPGCPTCRNKIDFSRFITSVNASGGIDGSNGCDINLKIPWAYGDSVYKDGRFILNTGIEVFVYYRGFFQVKELALKVDNIDLENGEILSAPDAETRPYYPVFHGVISGVSVDYSDGAFSVSISTRNMLSFWDNQQINTQQGYFAADPTMSRGSINLKGHVYTNMTPHQIIYSLFLDAGGSAEGTGYTLKKKTNIKARSSTGPQLYSLMLRYLEQRFKNGMYGLRMYGASGRMYTAIETQIVASQAVTRSGAEAEFRSVVKKQNKPYAKEKSNGLSFSRMVKAGMIAYEFNNADGGRIQRTVDARYLSQVSEKDKVGLSVLSLKPFATDIGQFAEVNFFESSLESKKAIAGRVCEVTGYEFYQDMDGDLVFKPPMYNMDTSTDRVYNIYREDLISISYSHSEPEATYVTIKGSHYRNSLGAAPTGEWGIKGVYVDYSLVAKYGWKGAEFDSTFYNSAKQTYYAAAVELDKQNKNTEGCEITIPLRPEIKPGYPVYVEENDCYYYVETVSHSFSYGGSCTTTLTLVCQRKKFIPPGDSSVKYANDPARAVDLGRTELPERYIYKRYDRTDEGNRQINAQSTEEDIAYRKITGFPNVVMAFDHQNASPSMLYYDPDFQSIGGKGTKERERYQNMIINEGIRVGVLNVEEGGDIRKGPWFLYVPSGDGGSPRKVSLKLVGDSINGIDTLRSQSESSRLAAEKAEKSISKAKRRKRVKQAQSYETAEKKRQNTLQTNIQRAVGTAGVYGPQVDPNAPNYGTSQEATILDLIYLIQSPLGRSEKTSPLQNLMSALEDRKSSFAPKAQGYFRYYSSSHPSPEHQGPDLTAYNQDEEQDEPRLVFNDNVPDTVRDNIVKASPNGDGDTVVFGNSSDARQQITRGLLTRTMYSNGLEYVPTKDITSLSFQVSSNFTVDAVTGPKVSLSQIWYQRNYQPGLEYWQANFNEFVRQIKITKDTVLGDIFQHFNMLIEEPILTLTVPKVYKKLSPALWGGDIAKEYFEDGVEITPTTKDKVSSLEIVTIDPQTNEPKPFRVQLGRKMLGRHFAAIILYSLRERSIRVSPDSYNESVWEELYSDNSTESIERQEDLIEKVRYYVNNALSNKVTLPDIKNIQVERTKLKVTSKEPTITPIFPISDSKGYEVFGAYQYGRGLKASRGTLFDAILRQDPTQIFTPEDLTKALKSLDAADTQTQYRESLKQLYLEKIRGLNPQEKERIVVGVGLDAEIRDSETNELDDNALANRLMTSSDEQIITNIPSTLMEIYPTEDGNETCQCRIHNTDAILLEGALDLDNFLEIENPLLRSVRNQTERKSAAWREHQSALRGDNIQVSNSGFNNIGSNRLINAGKLAASAFKEAVSNVGVGLDNLSDQAKEINAKIERNGGEDN